MTGRLLLLCPGQGGQHAAMFDLARSHAGARDFLAACALPDDPQSLFENRVAQPAIVAATLAMWLALRESLGPIALVAGYSIGELAAYGVAGGLAPRDTLRIAGARAALMDGAAAGTAQGLAAVSGVDVALVRAWAPIAIVTGHDSCIAGGTRVQLDALPAHLPFVRIQPLPVGVASHTPLMQDAVAPFLRVLEGAPFGPLRCPVLAGVDAARVLRRDVAIDRLARNLDETIEWAACMDAANEAGIAVALELGPGSALARMLAARHPHIACRSVADFHTLDGIVKWVERQMD
jgi:[acyl-carrier-protein] S-malonyltransferase